MKILSSLFLGWRLAIAFLSECCLRHCGARQSTTHKAKYGKAKFGNPSRKAWTDSSVDYGKRFAKTGDGGDGMQQVIRQMSVSQLSLFEPICSQ